MTKNMMNKEQVNAEEKYGRGREYRHMVTLNVVTQNNVTKTVTVAQAEGFSRYLVADDGEVYALRTKPYDEEKYSSFTEWFNALEDGATIKAVELAHRTACKHGYQETQLVDDEGSTKYVKTHRLVIMAFCGEIPYGLQIDHFDFNRLNNSLKNLRVVTSKENYAHSAAAGRMMRDPRTGRFIKASEQEAIQNAGH